MGGETHQFLLVASSYILLIAVNSSYGAKFDGRNESHGFLSDTIEPLIGQMYQGYLFTSNLFGQIYGPHLCPYLLAQRSDGLDIKTMRDDGNARDPTLLIYNDWNDHNKVVRIEANDNITHEVIRKAKFDNTQLTVILVHGWIGGVEYERWILNVKDVIAATNERVKALRSQTTEDSAVFRPNIIIVDWSKLSHSLLLMTGRNTIVVSRRLSRLLSEIARLANLMPEMMHCFGHSYGAHICGQAARLAFPPPPGSNSRVSFVDSIITFESLLSSDNKINGNSTNFSIQSLLSSKVYRTPRMGRITALDPAGLCFRFGVQFTDTYMGLKPSDAHLVDGLYSDRDSFGNRHQLAMYNLRLNNGMSHHLCSLKNHRERARDLFWSLTNWTLGHEQEQEKSVCNHFYATRVAFQTLPAECGYVAYECPSWKDFSRGRCGACTDNDHSSNELPLPHTPAASTRCYQMDSEYQRSQPSVLHALHHIARYSRPPAIAYPERRVMFMSSELSDEDSSCNPVYRVRVKLDPQAVDIGAFKSSSMSLKIVATNTTQQREHRKPTWRDLRTLDISSDYLPLYGPWSDKERRLTVDADDNRTLTLLVDLVGAGPQPLVIEKVELLYEHKTQRNPIYSVKIDYLSWSSAAVRAKYSRVFQADEVRVHYAHENES